MRFKSYLFVKDEARTIANRRRKEGTYLFGILLFLIGIVFLILEFTTVAALVGLLGMVLFYTGKFILIYTPDKGAIPGEFIIDDDQITVLKQPYKIKELENLTFNLVTYDGGPLFNEFKKAEGHENEVSFKLNGKLLRMQFYIPTSKHYVDLIHFLDEKDIPFNANRGFPWPL